MKRKPFKAKKWANWCDCGTAIYKYRNIAEQVVCRDGCRTSVFPVLVTEIRPRKKK